MCFPVAFEDNKFKPVTAKLLHKTTLEIKQYNMDVNGLADSAQIAFETFLLMFSNRRKENIIQHASSNLLQQPFKDNKFNPFTIQRMDNITVEANQRNMDATGCDEIER